MKEDEKKLDEYIARNGTATIAKEPAKQDAEQKVEDKAREGGPLSASILQKRSKLEPAKLENRIGQISAKYADRIDEAELRQRISKHLEANNEEISEADLQRITDQLLKKQEPEQPEQPGIQPPPFLNDSLQAAGDRARSAADWVAAAKTPGGIGLLVFILLFFIWAVVPVNDSNQTRLQLLWGIITGQVGWSQDIQNQENQLYQQAAQQSGIPGLLPSLGGGGQTVPVEVSTPFVPSFDEF